MFRPPLLDRKLTRLEFREEQEILCVGVELGAPFPRDKTSYSAEEDEDAEGDEAFRAFAKVLRSRGRAEVSHRERRNDGRKSSHTKVSFALWRSSSSPFESSPSLSCW